MDINFQQDYHQIDLPNYDNFIRGIFVIIVLYCDSDKIKY